MIEKVNPSHPDKIADRIAGALVDYAYTLDPNPKAAFEVLIGHGRCLIIGETSVRIDDSKVWDIIKRINGKALLHVDYKEVGQDQDLAKNQKGAIRAGDNGIFRGMPINDEVRQLSTIARSIYAEYPSDGKYILDRDRLIICQSNATYQQMEAIAREYDKDPTINPLGEWMGGINVDTGAVNRKLGSDMGEAVTGGGLHGKDLSKGDVSVNIYAHILAQERGLPVEISCAIGDATVDGKPYEEIVDIAREYVRNIGGFEKLAEWGLV